MILATLMSKREPNQPSFYENKHSGLCEFIDNFNLL